MSGNVRAKVKCWSKTTNTDGTGSVTLSPVYDPNPESENGQFWQATPSGTFSMSGIKGAALDAFEQGKEYYVDFSPAEVAEPVTQ